MQIDYFNDGSSPKEDKSSWFASVTSLSGCLNGSVSPYTFLNPSSLKPNRMSKHGIQNSLGDITNKGYMGLIICYNLLQGPMQGTQIGSMSANRNFEVPKK